MITHISVGQIPALKALIPFILGIVCYPALIDYGWPLTIFFGCCWIGICIIHNIPWKLRRRLATTIFPILFFMLWFLGGIMLCFHTDHRNHARHLSYFLDTSTHWQAVLKTAPQKKKNGWTVQVEVIRSLNKNKSTQASGFVSVWLKDHEKVNQLQAGTSVLFKNKIEEIIDNALPGNFSFAKWQAKKQIYHHAFLYEKDWYILKQPSEYNLQVYLSKIRNHCIQALQKFIPTKSSSALAQAMTLGIRSDIDPSLMQAYSDTGIIHLIAISGLHVGLIYLLLNQTIGLFRIRNKFFNLLLLLSGVWAFTLLTGAGPSVCRAATMCSFLVIGKTFSKRPQTLNSIAASALLLLLIEPRWIYEIGFQLSYAAVIGIGMFQPILQKWVYLENKLLRLFWDTICVTWSAQAFTFPLVLYYFHQFPIFFWASNLVVVPMAAGILYGCIAVLLLSWLSPLATFLGSILNGWLHWVNEWIFLLSQLPFAVKNNIFIELETCVFILCCMLFLAFWLVKPSKWSIHFTIFLCIIWSSFQALQFYQILERKEVWIFPEEKDFSAWLIHGKQSTAIFSKKQASPATSKALLSLNTQPSSTPINRQDDAIWSEGTCKIFVLHDTIAFQHSLSAHSSTYMIIKTIPKKIKYDWLKSMKGGTIIWTPILPPNQLWKWKKAADSLHLRHHDLKKQGPLQIKLPTNYP
ncbi:MAG: ComEC family competence protein [Sediminibacterium sp.]|nr:ComEC family competence protein [Sediminibacterium sp.]